MLLIINNRNCAQICKSNMIIYDLILSLKINFNNLTNIFGNFDV